MTDIIEHAEDFCELDHRVYRFVGSVPIIRELVTELKDARAEIERLKEFEWMYQELQ